MRSWRRSRAGESAGWNWRLRLAELLLLPAGYWLYALVRDREGRAQRPDDFARAQGHAEHLLHVERDLGLAWERGVQEVFLHQPGLVRALDSFWSYGYLVVTVSVVILALAQRPAVYRRLRSTFGLATAVSIGVFALLPTVPPRLLPRSYGIIDTWAALGGISARNPPEIERLSDPFASFPSIHVAWATWCVIAVAAITRRRWIRALMACYLVLTVVAVLATGNHFVLDCLVGALLAVGCHRAVTVVEHRRARLATGAGLRRRWLLPGPVRPAPVRPAPLAGTGPDTGAAGLEPVVTALQAVAAAPVPLDEGGGTVGGGPAPASASPGVGAMLEAAALAGPASLSPTGDVPPIDGEPLDA